MTKKHPEIKPSKLVEKIMEEFDLNFEEAVDVYRDSKGLVKQYKVQGDEKELLACFRDYETMDEYLDYLREEVVPKYKDES